MQDIIRPDASFTPRELFSRMQGAWFEPRQGYMWQENNGLTATTGGGQTIGLLLDGSKSIQYGPELISNGGFDSDTVWSKDAGWGISGGVAVATSAAAGLYIKQDINSLLTVGRTYEIKFSCVSYTSGQYGFALSGNAVSSLSLTGTGSYVYRFTLPSFISIVTGIRASALTATFDNVSIREIIGNHAAQSTLANRPTLQYAKGLPLVRCDSNDFMTVYLPAINVRRNLLTYSEQFDNGVWIKENSSVFVLRNCLLAPDGSETADKVIASSNNQLHYVYQAPSTSSGAHVMSFYAKSGGYDYCWMNYPGGAPLAVFNLQSGTVISESSPGIAAITPVGNGWYRLFVTASLTSGVNNLAIGPSNAGSRVAYTGDDISGIYIWGAQLELGSTATDYQRVTDWTSEAYSQSGSVYFATPQGMSCLHNQSIGTSYNLPAPQTDIYGTVITPARLTPPLEQRLALYMHRLAGLSDADFFWQEQATDGMEGQLLADDNDTILLRA